MATIPSWLNIGPDLFLQAAQAGGQRQEAVATREQQAALADAQRSFQYDELAQRAADAEAQRAIQLENINAQRYEAAVRANAGVAESQMRNQMEDQRLRQQIQQNALLRGDKLAENQFDQNLALQKLKSGEAQFAAGNDLRAGELATRRETLEQQKEKLQKEEQRKNDLFNKIREALKGGGRVSDAAAVTPEILDTPAGRAIFQQENQKKSFMDQLMEDTGKTNAPVAFQSADEVRAAYKAKKLTKEQALKELKAFGFE